MIVTLPSNKYDQIQEIARGGMGIIFKAHHKYLHRWTAVKVLYPHLAADAGFIERFKREARTMARLDHDGIIRIYDVEPGEETYGLVMEYVEGQDLKRVQRARGALPSGDVVAIALQIAEALAYAHSVGVVHRDIKPGNILVGSDSRVKVGDFGIASALDEITVTMSGQVLGTPEYMAPEQLHGGPIDGRTDLYAVGMTMATLAIGQSPFHNRPRASVLAELTMMAEHVLVWPPTIPQDLRAVIERLVRKQPADRYQDAQGLVEDLRRLAQVTRSRDEPPATAVPTGAEESPTEDLRSAETEPGDLPLGARARWSKMAAGVAGIVVVGLALAWGLRGQGIWGPGSAGEEALRLKEAKNAVEVAHSRMKVEREAAKEAGSERLAPVMAKAGAKAEAEGDRGRQEASALIATSRDVEAKGSLERAAASYRSAETAYRQAGEVSLKARPSRSAAPFAPAAAAEGSVSTLTAPQASRPVSLSPPREPPGMQTQSSRPTQPTLEDAEAVTARLETVRLAAGLGDLGAVREALDVAPSHERFLAQLFTDYRDIRLTVGQVQIGRGVATARLTFERLVNQAGQEVVPAASWREMDVLLEKRGGAWSRPRW